MKNKISNKKIFFNENFDKKAMGLMVEMVIVGVHSPRYNFGTNL